MASVYQKNVKMSKTMQIRFSEAFLEKVDAWGLAEKMPSRSQAIRELIAKGLETLQK